MPKGSDGTHKYFGEEEAEREVEIAWGELEDELQEIVETKLLKELHLVIEAHRPKIDAAVSRLAMIGEA